MNARTVIAADGLPRRLFTVAEVERMVEVGLIDEDERIELVEGELIPMSPKGNEHEIWKTSLLEYWISRRSRDVRIAVETTFRLSPSTYVEPDLVVLPREVGFSGLSGRTALLAVEIGISSLNYDLGRKAQVYAAHGLRELWVIDPVAGMTTVHRAPGPEGYASISRHALTDNLVPEAAPHLAVLLSELDLGH